MKYKVIGWTDDMNADVPDISPTFAMENAIVDAIREGGYDFTGYQHQEFPGGVPVFNFGYKASYSQRGFGRMMAEAHGMHGSMDYVYYTFYNEDGEYKMPRDGYNPREFVSEESIREEYIENIDKSKFDLAASTNKITLYDMEKYRYIDENDTIILTSGDEVRRYTVAEASRELDVTAEEQEKYLKPGGYGISNEDRAAREELYTRGKYRLAVALKPKD